MFSPPALLHPYRQGQLTQCCNWQGMEPTLLLSCPWASSPESVPPGPALLSCSGEVPGCSPMCCSQQRAGPSLFCLETLTLSQMRVQTGNVCMVFGDNMSHRHRYRPLLLYGHGPRHRPQQPHGPGPHHGLGWQRRPLTSGCFSPSSHLQFYLSSQSSNCFHFSTNAAHILAHHSGIGSGLAASGHLPPAHAVKG